jgi:hypothetical protein
MLHEDFLFDLKTAAKQEEMQFCHRKTLEMIASVGLVYAIIARKHPGQ